MRLIRAFFYSCEGLKAAFCKDAACRLQCIIASLLIPLACLLHVTPEQRRWLIASVAFSLIVELLNTAIEKTVDRISEARHPLAKEAKDIASAAVLCAFAFSAYTWISILLEIAKINLPLICY